MNIIKGSVDIKPKYELLEITIDTIGIYDFKLETKNNNGDYDLVTKDLPFNLDDADFNINDGSYKYSRNNKIELVLVDHSNPQPPTDRDNSYEPDEYESVFEISNIIVKNNKVVDIGFK